MLCAMYMDCVCERGWISIFPEPKTPWLTLPRHWRSAHRTTAVASSGKNGQEETESANRERERENAKKVYVEVNKNIVYEIQKIEIYISSGKKFAKAQPATTPTQLEHATTTTTK